jgi:hypothetical protein
MLKCSKSYGITISQPYSAYLHAERNAYKDPFDNEWKAKEQMGWLIKKGDLILSNKPKEASTKFCRRFGVGDPRVFVTNLVTYSGEDAPQSLGEVPAGKQRPRSLRKSRTRALNYLQQLQGRWCPLLTTSARSRRIDSCSKQRELKEHRTSRLFSRPSLSYGNNYGSLSRLLIRWVTRRVTRRVTRNCSRSNWITSNDRFVRTYGIVPFTPMGSTNVGP